MGFLAPLWLGLAGLVAVPLVLHLWRRRIGVRVEFPAARYLRRAEEEHSRDLKVKNLLLMLLRVLAVLAIAIAAARPAARLPGGGHAPTAMAIVLDNSLSTTVVAQGEPVLERLRRAARAVAARAAVGDRLWLVTADGVVTSGDAATIGAAIARVEPLGGAGDLGAAVRRGAALARAAGLEAAELAVITDGQASAWTTPLDLGEVAVVVHAPAVQLPPNRAVVGTVARPVRWTPRGALAARVRGPGDSVTWRATIAGRTLARGTVVTDARGSEVAVTAAPPERGWVTASVELEPDELRGDDVGHAALYVGSPPGLAVSTGAGPFARSAADALVQAGSARIGSDAARGDVAITAAEDLARLPALVAAPLDPVRVGAANRALERAGVPWRFGAAVRGEATVASDDSLLAARTPGGGVGVQLRYPLVRAGTAPADTLARVGRDPWIVAGPGYVLVGSPLDPSATTLPVRAAFVPWMAQALAQRLAGEPGALVQATPLARIALPAGADELQRPDGGVIPLRGDSVAAPAAPGVYLVRRAARQIGALVVNVEPEETELRRLDGEELGRRFEARVVEVEAVEERFTASAFGAGARRPLTGWFIALALAALLVETLVAARGRGAARAPGGAARAAA